MTIHTREWTGKIFIATSLDGFIARSDGDISWLVTDADAAGHVPGTAGMPSDMGYAEHMSSVDHVVMGRGTYEKVLTFGSWPYPDQAVIVLSSSLEVDDDRITVVRSVADVAALLENRNARAVYIDGGATIQAFLREGLIDTIVLTRVPVLIGDGLPLFGSIGRDVRLLHEGTSWTDTGFVQSRYRVAIP